MIVMSDPAPTPHPLSDAGSKRSTCPTPPHPRLFQSFQTFNRFTPFKTLQTNRFKVQGSMINGLKAEARSTG